MSSGVTVVLGWDGLDFEVATEFGLVELFGDHTKKIDTIDNPELGKPHTMELWPSIITGLTPQEHGLQWSASDDRADWKDPRIDRLSRVAEGMIPKRLRTRIGRVLLNAGSELGYTEAEEYGESGIETMFDGRVALPIAIPNYRTALDLRLDVETNREWELGEYLNLERDDDGEIHHEPEIPLSELELRLGIEAYTKLGLIHTSVHREYDVIFVWFSFLDTVGHLSPVADPGWQERGYRIAARETRQIGELLEPEDTLVCVSDHGLQGGSHTHHAFLGASDKRVVAGIESVIDVREGIDRVTPSSGERDGYPDLRPPYRSAEEGTRRTADEVRSQLEDLGYM